MTTELHQYVLESMAPLDDRMRRALDRSGDVGEHLHLRIAPEQGRVLTMLARLTGTRRAVEVGTFTGFSALSIADGLTDGGELLCFEINEEWAKIAETVWEEAGVSDRIQVTVGAAIEGLRALPRTPDRAIDFAFVDADKIGYWDYFEELVERTRPGGLLVFDNVLYEGDVLDPDGDTPAGHIREFNRRLAVDDRVELAVLTMADGMTLARKR